MLHGCDILLGDIQLPRFGRAHAPGGAKEGTIWVIDFTGSVHIPSLCQEWKDEEMLALHEHLARAMGKIQG